MPSILEQISSRTEPDVKRTNGLRILEQNENSFFYSLLSRSRSVSASPSLALSLSPHYRDAFHAVRPRRKLNVRGTGGRKVKLQAKYKQAGVSSVASTSTRGKKPPVRRLNTGCNLWEKCPREFDLGGKRNAF